MRTSGETLHPVLYGYGLCQILLGLLFPFCYWNHGPGLIIPAIVPVIILTAMITALCYHLYTYNEDEAEKKKRRDEVAELCRSNLYLCLCHNVFRMGVITGVVFLFTMDF